MRRYLPVFAVGVGFLLALFLIAPYLRDDTVTVPVQVGWVADSLGAPGARVDVVAVRRSSDGEAHVATLAENALVGGATDRPGREGGRPSADFSLHVSKRQRDRIAAADPGELRLLVRSVGR